MTDIVLQPMDILVSVTDEGKWWTGIKKFFVGEHDHVFVYIGKWDKTHMLFESNGRGVVLQSLCTRNGELVDVMRLKEEYAVYKSGIFLEAIKLASLSQAYYDYMAIVKYILPQAILRKLHLTSLVPYSWQRDKRYICSEAVLEVFMKGGVAGLLPASKNMLKIFATGMAMVWRQIRHYKAIAPLKCPLPEDFMTSPCLDNVGRTNIDINKI